MEEKFMRVILFLDSRSGWTTSNELAQYLGCSKRSIKNYVQQINGLVPNGISASQNGYQLTPSLKNQVFSDFQIDPAPNLQSLSQRRKQLILALLRERHKLNVFDLGELLFISPTTLKNDLNKIREEFSNYELKIAVSGDFVEVLGSEKNKRQLFIDQVYDDYDTNSLSIAFIEKLFPAIPVEQISELTFNLLKENNLFVDDYLLTSIVLHLTIMVERIKNSHTLTINTKIEVNDPVLYSIAKQLVTYLEESSALTFATNEIYEVYVLLLAKTSTVSQKKITKDNIIQFVDPQALTIVEEIMAFLNDFYVIDIEDEGFLIPFTVHINNLLTRSQTAYFLKNPLLASIKEGHPFVYELSVSIAHIINKQISNRITDDEIGFLALHLGGAFAKENKKYRKLLTALVIPDIRTLTSDLKTKIEKQFGDSLFIDQVYTRVIDYNDFRNFDVIITTIPLALVDSQATIINISPFFNLSDQKKIYFDIEEALLKKRYDEFKQSVWQVSDSHYFMKNDVLTTKKDVIQVVADIFVNAGIVQADFEEQVLLRETLSSTAYNNIAIPHTIKMNARHSKMYIICSDRPIDWGNEEFVNIVFLFAINDKDKKIFYTIFEMISLLFSDRKKVLSALKHDDYQSFLNFLTNQDIQQ
ncbi:BglG family transcription antiterminator [Vagococcus sp. BWB3-3]|uniref:BglG family transcription antiterminator n=1 Tax=Vagococcus allomyrinae TaxID=2794353 RepID=A0A940SUN9_9ENTE|nr:PRD domain-containing protein [Vagococcus allomyrinae]MBP1041009.1 BglG family transcription antiterminator [Vagococcus allomyrinae]